MASIWSVSLPGSSSGEYRLLDCFDPISWSFGTHCTMQGWSQNILQKFVFDGQCMMHAIPVEIRTKKTIHFFALTRVVRALESFTFSRTEHNTSITLSVPFTWRNLQRRPSHWLTWPQQLEHRNSLQFWGLSAISTPELCLQWPVHELRCFPGNCEAEGHLLDCLGFGSYSFGTLGTVHDWAQYLIENFAFSGH